MRPFKRPDRTQISLLPPAIEDWLPENHLARFVVEIVEELDLTSYYSQYGTTGSTPYDPGMLLSLLFYGYATGVFSSRKIESATYDSVAFRYISGDLHPDHDTVSNFRQRFLPQIQQSFSDILLVGSRMGLIKMGNVHIDGTKVQANASRHSAMSYGHMEKLEAQITQEVKQLLEFAQQTDQQETSELEIPKELEIREQRLKKIRQAKAELEQRSKDRFKQRQQEYKEKMAERKAKEQQTGKKTGGKPPKPLTDQGPESKDQYNFTDPESRIMKTGKGYDQCYNGQAAVNEQMLIMGAHLTTNATDLNELIPSLESIDPRLGKVEVAVADAGYFSQGNVEACKEKQIESYLATGRIEHNQWLAEQLENPSTHREDEKLSPKQQMARKLKTAKGKAAYRLRKMTVEPVFGIIKEAMGFRRFLLRGAQNAEGEWMLVCSAYNIKRMFSLMHI